MLSVVPFEMRFVAVDGSADFGCCNRAAVAGEVWRFSTTAATQDIKSRGDSVGFSSELVMLDIPKDKKIES